MPDRDYYLDAVAAHGRDPRRSTRRTSRRCSSSPASPDADAKAARDLRAGAPHRARRTRRREDSADVKKGNNHWTRADFATERARAGLERVLRGAPGSASSPSSSSGSRARSPGIAALVASAAARDLEGLPGVPRARALRGVLPKAFVDGALRVLRHRAHRHAAAARPLEARRSTRPATRSARRSASSTSRSYFPPADKARVAGDGAEHHGRVRPAHRRARLDGARDQGARPRPSSRCSKVGVGYPDKWRDYSALEIVRGDAFGNAERAELFEYRRNLAKLGQPVDRGEWVMTPQTVNAVNLPVMNAMNFPAAILQPPFFDPDAAGGDGLRRDRRRDRPRDQPQLRRPGRAVRRRPAGCANWWTRRGPRALRGVGRAAGEAVRRATGRSPTSPSTAS